MTENRNAMVKVISRTLNYSVIISTIIRITLTFGFFGFIAYRFMTMTWFDKLLFNMGSGLSFAGIAMTLRGLLGM